MKPISRLPLALLACFSLASLLLSGAYAQSAPGTVRALDVQGDVVLRIHATGIERPLMQGESFGEGHSVLTGPGASVVLVQSNGAAIDLEENSSLSIDEFLQDAFDPSLGAYSSLSEDPSPSRTRLKLNYGNAVGHVKKLHRRSSYHIDLPTASAGIRGTTWQARVTIDLVSGLISCQFTCTQGQFEVNFQANLSEVGSGESIEIRASLGPGSTQDQPIVLNIFSDGVAPASPELVATINRRVEEMLSLLESLSRDFPSSTQPGERGEDDESQDHQTSSRLASFLESQAKTRLAQEGLSVDKINRLTLAQAIAFLGSTFKQELFQESSLDPGDILDLSEEQAEAVLAALRSGQIDPGLPDLEEDPAIAQLLALGFTQADLLALLVEGRTPSSLLTFTNSLAAAGNNAILAAILDLRDPTVNPRLIEAGELANQLIADRTFSGQTSLPSNLVYNRARLLDNDFNLAVLQLAGRYSGNEIIADSLVSLIENRGFGPSEGADIGLLTDIFKDNDNLAFLGTRNRARVGDLFGLTMDDLLVVFGREITLADGLNLNIAPELGDSALAAHPGEMRVLILGGLTEVNIAGDATIQSGNPSLDNALVIGSAENLMLAPGSTVSYDGGSFILAARDDITVVDMHLQSGGNLIVGTLDDLVIRDSSLTAPEEVILYADNQITLDGATFLSSPRSIYLEAITLSLRNVDFPAGSEVDLISQFGGVGPGQNLDIVNGRYPVFGQFLPGRVNFLSGVSYGGQPLDSESAFDTVPHDIDIRAMAPQPGP